MRKKKKQLFLNVYVDYNSILKTLNVEKYALIIEKFWY